MSSDLLTKIKISAAVILVGAAVAYAVVHYSNSTPKEDTLEVWDGGKEKHPVYINTPHGEPMVDSGKRTVDGKIIPVRCNTCHANKTPNMETHSGEELTEFHQDMKFKHNSLSCVSCHNKDNYETLHLANGKTLEFKQVMQLCAQCHGPQYRDYKNGSHGGMTGYWDLTKGPRQRNTCTDCHSAHVPAYPKVRPVFKPKVRTGSKLPQHDKH